MKKITLLSLLMLSSLGFAQSKSTGVVTLTTNMTANLTLNNSTSKATLVLTGPADRWFALQFGSFVVGGGMGSGQDLVYSFDALLRDAKHNGIGQTPTDDPINNWTVLSNIISGTTRTITAERDFSTGDANDYTFNYADTSIDFAWARRSSVGFTLNGHGSNNRGYQLNKTFTTLGVEDFSLNASAVFPNPSNGAFTVSTKTTLNEINVYSQTGALVKTIKVEDSSEKVDVSIDGLQSGVYLIELKNDSDKSWKKVIVN
jgi:Secretion system C-terminal sorting domain